MPSLTKADPFRRNHLLRDASYQAVYEAMEHDPNIHIFGEGAQIKVHYDAPKIKERFYDRVHTLPISEDGNTNFAVGAALAGVIPIVDVISADFLYRTLDSIANTAAKLNFVRQGQVPITMVIRAEFFTGGPTTGQRPEALFVHIPGLKVVLPSTPRASYILMKQALQGPGVTLFFEDREIDDAGPWYGTDQEYGWDDEYGIPAWRQFGDNWDLTVLTYGVMRPRVEAAVMTLSLRPCVVDLPSLYPLDWGSIEGALQTTERLLIVEPDVQYGGIGAEIAAQVAERYPTVRIKRLGARRQTVPAAMSLHDRMLPTQEEILDAIRSFD